MRVGVPREIKVHEYRVGVTPAGVRELVARGHEVIVQTGAGAGIGLDDRAYLDAGARVEAQSDAVWGHADLVVKVKEPQASEYPLLRAGQLLFTYLHLAPDPPQADALLASGCTAIAYETVTDAQGALPLLAPMSEVAGRMAVQAGAHALQKAQGGSGVLLAGVPGVAPGHVVVLGGGTVGYNAARIAMGIGARVTVLERAVSRLRWLDDVFGGRITTGHAMTETVERAVAQADLVIGAVLVPGASAPRLVTRAMLRTMRPGSVIVDVAIDQGGCCETSRPTTHADPTFVEEGIVHYCVANMPGGVARTATFALTSATLPFVLALAAGGLDALRGDPMLQAGLNVHRGQLTHAAVAQALGQPFVAPGQALGPC